MKICDSCGVQNTDESAFCSHCGKKLAPLQQQSITEDPSKKPPVPVSKERILLIAASYIAAYLRIADNSSNCKWEAFVMLALVVAGTEALNKNKTRPAESWVWLACYALCTISRGFMLGTVWHTNQTGLFAFIFGVWWILSRSGMLLENASGHLLPADAFNGFIIFPFKNYLLRFRTLVTWARSIKKDKEKASTGRVIWTVSAAVVCLLLFSVSASLLMEADDAFAAVLNRITGWLTIDIDSTLISNIFLSIPLGCLICGLLLGTASDDRSIADRRRERVYDVLKRIRRVPEKLWIAVICLFSAMYVVFFVLQGSYLFGAFAGKLPEGFIVAEYARQGFFELCKVMVLNSVLLWMATRMLAQDEANRTSFKGVCLALLAESMLFAVIALSKLVLYISIYGFTPLRLQSTWLVCVLLAACILWAYTIITDRPVFRKWMIFGAVSLSILTVI